MAACARTRLRCRAPSSALGRFSSENRRSKRANAFTGSPLARFITFRRDCRSTIWPDRKASRSVSVLDSPAARKLDSRASASGTAQGSPRWSVGGSPARWRSSRKSPARISRLQSSAPDSSQADCTRARSAASTSTPRHWRHSAPAANVATRATVIMAVSKAAPDWCPHAPRLRLVRCPPRGLQPALGAARRRSGTCFIARLRSPAAPNPRSAAQPAPAPAPG